MPLIVFSHANSFPASTYRVLFKSLRQRGFTVKAVERFGHDPAYPVTDNWPHLVQQLADFTRREVDKAGEPAFLVGHSLGGFLSLMAAARHPELARGVLLVRHDFIEGVRAVIVDKDNAPKWDPSTPEGVTDTLLDEIFAPLPAEEEWKPL